MAAKAVLMMMMLLVCIPAVPASGATTDPPDEYWISFTGLVENWHGTSSAGPKYLMKIDALGNVLIPAQKVIPNSKFYTSPDYGATAISQNGRWLNMWMPERRGVIQFYLFHAVIPAPAQ